MKKKFLRFSVMSFLLVSLLVLSGCSKEIVEPPKIEVPTREDLGEYGMVTLSFPIFSDIHFSSVCDEYVREYYPKALKLAMKNSKNMLDAVIVAGDFSEGYLKDYDTLIGFTRQGVGSNTPLIASYGNHEGDGKHYQYEQKFGKPIDNVNEVNGYNIILLGAHEKNTYTEEQNAWLDMNLAEMTAKDPNKPVFVVVHHPVYDTHTENFGAETFRKTLDKYPQAFVISGHEHKEFSEESIWKGTFISFRNSYLRNEEKGQFAILKLTDKNIVVIEKYEVTPTSEEPYIIGDNIIIDLSEFYNSKK